MTALAAGVARQFKDTDNCIFTEYPVEAGETLYQGGLVMLDTDGYVLAATATASQLIVGWADETVVNAGADGAAKIRVRSGCTGLHAASSITIAMIGDLMECVDDNTVDDAASNDVKVGVLVAPYVSTTQGWVWIPPYGMHTYGL